MTLYDQYFFGSVKELKNSVKVKTKSNGEIFYS